MLRFHTKSTAAVPAAEAGDIGSPPNMGDISANTAQNSSLFLAQWLEQQTQNLKFKGSRLTSASKIFDKCSLVQ